MVLIGMGGKYPAERQVLHAMFRARKHVFVDILKWDVPVLGGQYEIDEFDDEHAIYVLILGKDGHHLASARLLPTTRPHILETLFPDLCTHAVPKGPRIFEITRFCLDPGQRARERRHARNLLVSTLVSFALQRGISIYTGVAELGWLQQILAFGWDCRPLGPPCGLERRMLGALAIHIASDTPLRLAEKGIWATTDGPAADLLEAA